MDLINRAVVLMVRTFITITLLLCTAWCAITIHLLMVYGPLEGITFAMGSIMLLVIIYGMKRSDDRRRDRRCDRRHDHT